MSQPTLAQQSAIDARGNVLVVAGAGAGKTRTLVERCLAWLLEDPEHNGLDQILMVTFTEAAGAEMRKRLRDRLEKIAGNSPRWAEQLALLETAHICTLHSFCLRLVRQHFYELGLDPQLMVLADDQSRLLARKAMDAILEQHYNDETALAGMVQDLIQEHGRGWDKPVRELISQIHEYTQTLRDPEGWFAEQLKYLNEPEPLLWRQWLLSELQEWRRTWQRALEPLANENPNAEQCAEVLASLPAKPAREEFAAALAQIIDTDLAWPRQKKGVLRAQIEKIYSEAQFLRSLCEVGASDPLTEDWHWVRPQMLALLGLARQFEAAFTLEKRELGGLDFHDLEQFAKRLLWAESGRPSALAEHWRAKFRLIFVDEYQDINAVQDAIIQALGGEESAANRFLVGDVKQSIYRFRLANPRIFLRYQELWRTGAHARVVALSENFRSHEGILNFVNGLFGVLMRRELGGIDYDGAARLQFGNRAGRAALTGQPGEAPPVELHLRLPASDDDAALEDESLSEVEKEARWVAGRLLELKNQPAPVMGETQRRPATWNDMVILLRSPRAKVEAYVKEFTRLGVPLIATRGGFYESLEVRDLLALLQLLDNPLQDFPLLAVLRSPLGAFSADDLATLRASQRSGRFWTALVRWHEVQGQAPEAGPSQPLFERVDGFLKRFYAWRRSVRHLSLSQCLEGVLNETHYAEWLLTQERGAQRQGNVERLLQLTRQFDVFQREGLFRFLKFVQAQQDIEIDAEPAAPPASEAVRLMSIHQSKGLEFPIVVLADLGKSFNFGDLHGKIILDEELGLCPQVKPPQARQFYPSLPFWMAQRRQRGETLGEELRLLYVALTRAAERLILVGTLRGKKALERWPRLAACGAPELLGASSVLDWLGAWLARENAEWSASGASSLLTWTLHQESAGPQAEAAIQPPSESITAPAPAQWEALRARLEGRYPAQAATCRPAKVSVSSLRREMEEESARLFEVSPRMGLGLKKSGKLSAAEMGSAHHAFLEMVALDCVGSVAGLKAEGERLCREQRLTGEQAGSLDFEALAQFWSSEVGRTFLARRPGLRRELAFTARFGARELEGLSKTAQDLGEEFIVVQGVIDLAAILPEEIWLLDFKTDRVKGGNVEEKVKQYRPQLELYSRAISAIYRKPVTRSWLYFLSGGIAKSLLQ